MVPQATFHLRQKLTRVKNALVFYASNNPHKVWITTAQQDGIPSKMPYSHFQEYKKHHR